jgi:DNA-directed RNA polymerase specialized sigma24 family protein
MSPTTVANWNAESPGSQNARQVLHAVSLEIFTQEAAAQLQMSEVGVRVTLHRALKSLAALFSQGNS